MLVVTTFVNSDVCWNLKSKSDEWHFLNIKEICIIIALRWFFPHPECTENKIHVAGASCQTKLRIHVVSFKGLRRRKMIRKDRERGIRDGKEGERYGKESDWRRKGRYLLKNKKHSCCWEIADRTPVITVIIILCHRRTIGAIRINASKMVTWSAKQKQKFGHFAGGKFERIGSV